MRLLNIIINAVEAMTPGKGLLTLQTAKQRDKAVITITDNGPGIPEDTRTRLFDPFFTNKPKGTGLGLTSTQNIIMNHKGTVHVESEMGEGSVFTIILPTTQSVVNETKYACKQHAYFLIQICTKFLICIFNRFLYGV